MVRVHVRCWQETIGDHDGPGVDDPGFVAVREGFWTAALTDERDSRCGWLLLSGTASCRDRHVGPAPGCRGGLGEGALRAHCSTPITAQARGRRCWRRSSIRRSRWRYGWLTRILVHRRRPKARFVTDGAAQVEGGLRVNCMVRGGSRGVVRYPARPLPAPVAWTGRSGPRSAVARMKDASCFGWDASTRLEYARAASGSTDRMCRTFLSGRLGGTVWSSRRPTGRSASFRPDAVLLGSLSGRRDLDDLDLTHPDLGVSLCGLPDDRADGLGRSRGIAGHALHGDGRLIKHVPQHSRRGQAARWMGCDRILEVPAPRIGKAWIQLCDQASRDLELAQLPARHLWRLAAAGTSQPTRPDPGQAGLKS